ncbi:unnamed protein product [Lepeophtheirus salmonis]|uniref:(salmon louse) hypothetical protein n=1 Tax=Lepeophtheirus salmonis TaxID=72036 RepID=A0A7R8CI17_LEPSM|nr:unnamed protein product [Lepeophtheirus salmonis]CAF2828436.1 unnamed protein product [Lepeophtheirus salmonis]
MGIRKGHELDSFFEAKDVDEDDSDSVCASKKNTSKYSKIEKCCAFCNNLPNFNKYIIDKIECKKPMQKLGIDGDQGFFLKMRVFKSKIQLVSSLHPQRPKRLWGEEYVCACNW